MFLPRNQQGIALVLSVLILTNLFVITIIVTDVIVRIGRQSREIGQSEIAYFAAESAVEEAIYNIEQLKNASALGTLASPQSGFLPSTAGSWQRFIEPIFTIPVTCVDDDQRFSYFQVADLRELLVALVGQLNVTSCLFANDFSSSHPIANGNELIVMLAPGRSFQIDFNIAAPTGIVFYPNQLDIDWTALPRPYGSASKHPAGRVVILGTDGQVSENTATANAIKVPPVGNLGDYPDYQVRVINESAEYVLYSFEPRGTDYLPVGILVTASGYYGSSAKERIVVLERRNWEIY